MTRNEMELQGSELPRFHIDPAQDNLLLNVDRHSTTGKLEISQCDLRLPAGKPSADPFSRGQFDLAKRRHNSLRG